MDVERCNVEPWLNQLWRPSLHQLKHPGWHADCIVGLFHPHHAAGYPSIHSIHSISPRSRCRNYAGKRKIDSWSGEWTCENPTLSRIQIETTEE